MVHSLIGELLLFALELLLGVVVWIRLGGHRGVDFIDPGEQFIEQGVALRGLCGG